MVIRTVKLYNKQANKSLEFEMRDCFWLPILAVYVAQRATAQRPQLV